MSRHYFSAIYFEAEEGGIIASVEELPEIHVQGETIAEARAALDDAIELVLTSNRALNLRTFRNARVLHRERLNVGQGAPMELHAKLSAPFLSVNEYPSGRPIYIGLHLIATMMWASDHTEAHLSTGDVVLVGQTPIQIAMQAENMVQVIDVTR